MDDWQVKAYIQGALDYLMTPEEIRSYDLTYCEQNYYSNEAFWSNIPAMANLFMNETDYLNIIEAGYLSSVTIGTLQLCIKDYDSKEINPPSFKKFVSDNLQVLAYPKTVELSKFGEIEYYGVDITQIVHHAIFYYNATAYYEMGNEIGYLIKTVNQHTKAHKPLKDADAYRFYRNFIMNLDEKSPSFDEQLLYNNMTSNFTHSYYETVVSNVTSNLCEKAKDNITDEMKRELVIVTGMQYVGGSIELGILQLLDNQQTQIIQRYAQLMSQFTLDQLNKYYSLVNNIVTLLGIACEPDYVAAQYAILANQLMKDQNASQQASSFLEQQKE
eukprot:403344330